MHERGKQCGGGNGSSRNQQVACSNMKVYFCGSIRGGRDDVIVYQRIVQKLQSYGSVLTEHVSSEELSSKGQRSHTHIHSASFELLLHYIRSV